MFSPSSRVSLINGCVFSNISHSISSDTTAKKKKFVLPIGNGCRGLDTAPTKNSSTEKDIGMNDELTVFIINLKFHGALVHFSHIVRGQVLVP